MLRVVLFRIASRTFLGVALVAAALAVAPLGVAAEPSPVFPARTVAFDDGGTLPDRGVVYVHTGRALTRSELSEAQGSAARFLGMVAREVYAFEVRSESGARFLERWDPVWGTATAEPEDKLEGDLLRLRSSGASHADAGLGLTVAFWPHATAGEVRAILGEPADLRLPMSDDAILGPQSVVVVPVEDARWLDLEVLLQQTAIAAVGLDQPKSPVNEASRQLAGSDQLAVTPFSLDGTGILVGHWDGGEVDAEHPDFGTRVRNLDRASVSSHATHTAGTILGAGVGNAAARGHAPAAEMVALDFNGNPTAERREVKHLYYHHHDNHSWGQNAQTVSNFGTYNQVALEFDIDARDLLLLPVKAAGNEGQDSEVIVDGFGFDSLAPDSTSKNALVVGATDNSGQLTGFSSRGPTEDARVKPDVVAVGAGVVSTGPGGGYFRAQGTSMSTPAVTGMLTLLAQLYERDSAGRRLHPDVARGLFIHTASDRFNPGPDFRYGWGMADVAAAAQLVMQDRERSGRHIVRGAVRDGERAEHTLEVPSGTAELKVTLTWLDAFINAPTNRRLLNDIDLVLVGPNGGRSQPWVLDADNPRQPATRGVNRLDNVEQVVVANPAAGRWTVVVEGTSVSDPDLSVQGYVLLTDLPVERQMLRLQGGQGAASVPDGQGSLDIPFVVSPRATVNALRVFLDLQHEARGDVRVELEHPDGTTVTLETEDTSQRRDIYAIYPDLRSYDDDVTALYGKLTTGTWTLRIRDVRAGNQGVVRHAEIELDLGAPPNRAPSAAIEGPTSGAPGDVLTLSGEGSADPDGNPLTFAWQQTEGPQAMMRGVSLDRMTLTVPEATAGAQLAFSLTVDDGQGATATATHAVTVRIPNQAPLAALAGPERARPGEEIVLDASGSSDPEGDPLTFAFRQTAGPAVLGPSQDGPRWRVTVPEGASGAAVVVAVQVDDGRGGQAEAIAQVNVEAAATAPRPIEPATPVATEVPEEPTTTGLSGAIGGASSCATTGTEAVGLWILLGLGWVLRRRRR